MSVQDSDILAVVTAEQATLTELSGSVSELGNDVATAIADIQALPSDTPVSATTLAALQNVATSLQAQAVALKTSAGNLDAVVNPPAPETAVT